MLFVKSAKPTIYSAELSVCRSAWKTVDVSVYNDC